MKKVSIYGVGNFGYALLKHLDEKKSTKFSLSVYDRNPELNQYLDQNRKHPDLFKQIKFSSRPRIAASSQELLDNCDILILSITSSSILSVLEEIKPLIKKPLIIVNTSKAFDNISGQRISQVAAKCLSGLKYDYAVLAGGTIASDLFNHEPLGASLACRNKSTLKILTDLFVSSNLFIYPTSDVAGVECAAAFKNVISILAGITNGLGFSYGAETHIISRVAAEVENLAIKNFKARRETFRLGSQCWGNDLWLSCTGQTRNRDFGILIGQGLSVAKACQRMQDAKKTVEGINTIKILPQISGLKNYYILNLINQFFSDQIDLPQFCRQLFNNRL
jgi:glycerol-3-phosphate dehydrogenase (NAD(P)+)